MITDPGTLEQLSERVDELEKRVSQLELGSKPLPARVEAPAPTDLERAAGAIPAISAGTSLSVLGKALLGIAGAYLLRAASGSSGAALRGVIAVVAVAYAVAWLAGGARAVARNRLAGILYTCTSLLILSPMFWEMTLRFRAMPASEALGLLAAYLVAIGMVARAPQRAAVFSVAYAGAAVTALSLSIATRAMAPFTAILLAMVLWDEIARFLRRPHAVAPLVLLTSDAAVWALLFIYRIPAGARLEYPDLAPAIVLAAPFLLFTLHAFGIAVRTRDPLFRIPVFDILQALLGIALVGCGLVWLAPQSAQIASGILCIVLAGACYAAALGPLRHSAYPRNVRVFALWSAALLLAGVYILLPASPAGVALGALSLAAAGAGLRLRCQALFYHAVLYLAAGAWTSGLLQYVFHTLAGQMPGAPSFAVIVLSIVAAAVYAVCEARQGDGAPNQAALLAPALLAALAACALAAHAVAAAAGALLTIQAPLIAFLRTLVLCAFAFGLALGGSRLKRPAMTRVAYTLIACVAAKLFFEDLRHPRLEFIAGSICLVAITLIGVPRVTGRSARRTSAS